MALELDHTLSRVDETNKAIYFETDLLDDLTVIGGKSGPRAAAAALRDIINLVKERW